MGSETPGKAVTPFLAGCKHKVVKQDCLEGPIPCHSFCPLSFPPSYAEYHYHTQNLISLLPCSLEKLALRQR